MDGNELDRSPAGFSRYFPNIQKKMAKNDRHFMAYADFLTIGRSLFLFIKGTNHGDPWGTTLELSKQLHPQKMVLVANL